MTAGINGTPLMVNVGTPEKPMWVDADAFDKGDIGNDFWSGVANGGQILTLVEIAAINAHVGPIDSVELPK